MYIGPEVIMPLASVLAAITGVLLMFWRRLTSFARAIAHGMTRTVSKIRSRD